jgi:hypothetical protein
MKKRELKQVSDAERTNQLIEVQKTTGLIRRRTRKLR